MITVRPTEKPHSQKCECGGEFWFQRYCGAWVCQSCDNHRGLCRCFCGWSQSWAGHGRQELEEMGETIDPDY